MLRQVLDGEAVPDDWANGCPADVVLFTELVNGTGTMPDDLLKLLPKPLKDAHQLSARQDCHTAQGEGLQF